MQTPIPGTNKDQIRTPLDRAAEYIQNHFAEEVRLDALAQTVGMSKFHFHRMFRARFGETIREYLSRIRLERAAFRIISGEIATVTQIAYDCGFSTSQGFARKFAAHFGLSPNQVRAGGWDFISRRLKALEGPYGKKHLLPAQRESGRESIRITVPAIGAPDKAMSQELEVVQMPAYRVAYIRRRISLSDPPDFVALREPFNQLVQWAAPKALFDTFSIVALWNDADSQGCFTRDVCLVLPDHFEFGEENEVQMQYLPGREYAVYHGKFQGIPEVPQTWERLYRGWWISSYFPRQMRPNYEIYYNDGSIHPEGIYIADLCMPITTFRE